MDVRLLTKGLQVWLVHWLWSYLIAGAMATNGTLHCASNPCIDTHERCVESGNSYSCVGAFACWSNPCKNGGTCKSSSTISYRCYCRDGYRLYNCEGREKHETSGFTFQWVYIGIPLIIVFVIITACIKRRRYAMMRQQRGGQVVVQTGHGLAVPAPTSTNSNLPAMAYPRQQPANYPQTGFNAPPPAYSTTAAKPAGFDNPSFTQASGAPMTGPTMAPYPATGAAPYPMNPGYAPYPPPGGAVPDAPPPAYDQAVKPV